MAPSNLPVSGPGYRTTSWSVHNGLLQDLEEQSVVGTSDSSLNLENDEILSRSVSNATEPTSAAKANRRCWGGSRYVEKYMFVGLWTCLLMCGYASARISAHLNIPPDSGTNGQDPFDTFEDISKMLQFGFLLGWFVGAFDQKRFAWLFHWRQIYWILIFIGTPPVYSAISRIPALQHSLADVSRWGAGMYILIIVVAMVALTVIIWHLYAAWTVHSKRGFCTYLGSRSIVLLFYLVFGLVTAHYSMYNTQHIHHFYIGWTIALFAEFNHPLSAVTLAIAMGVFAQGVGVYGFASMFEDGSCFTASAGQSMSCSFTSDTQVNLKICPQNAGAFDHNCYFGL
ncbi:hypothetical protein ABBQ38_012086 [Trebouxia sp. C0009 RCD-2024]